MPAYSLPPPHPSGPTLAGANRESPVLLHCQACGAPQPMQVNRVYPALYRGMDVIFCQCLRCGTETAQRLAGDASTPPADPDAAGRQMR